jgi:hypothetical protein
VDFEAFRPELNAADEQTHPILLLGKDMLDARTDF